MHQPDIDGERPLTSLEPRYKRIFKPGIQSTVVTLKPYDSAVKHILGDSVKIIGNQHIC